MGSFGTAKASLAAHRQEEGSVSRETLPSPRCILPKGNIARPSGKNLDTVSGGFLVLSGKGLTMGNPIDNIDPRFRRFLETGEGRCPTGEDEDQRKYMCWWEGHECLKSRQCGCCPEDPKDEAARERWISGIRYTEAKQEFDPYDLGLPLPPIGKEPGYCFGGDPEFS